MNRADESLNLKDRVFSLVGMKRSDLALCQQPQPTPPERNLHHKQQLGLVESLQVDDMQAQN